MLGGRCLGPMSGERMTHTPKNFAHIMVDIIPSSARRYATVILHQQTGHLDAGTAVVTTVRPTSTISQSINQSIN